MTPQNAGAIICVCNTFSMCDSWAKELLLFLLLLQVKLSLYSHCKSITRSVMPGLKNQAALISFENFNPDVKIWPPKAKKNLPFFREAAFIQHTRSKVGSKLIYRSSVKCIIDVGDL